MSKDNNEDMRLAKYLLLRCLAHGIKNPGLANDVRSFIENELTCDISDHDDSKLATLLYTFDQALNSTPHLWFELGYTRPTDWMIHIWDKTGDTERKIITTQDTDRGSACQQATKQLLTFTDIKQEKYS